MRIEKQNTWCRAELQETSLGESGASRNMAFVLSLREFHRRYLLGNKFC